MLNNKPSFPSSTPIPTANVFKDVNVIIIVPMRTSLSRKKKKKQNETMEERQPKRTHFQRSN